MLTGRSAVFLPEREWRRAADPQSVEDELSGGMGVGKNTTSKSMDSTTEPGKYEEENKHSAHFYPIPVSLCLCVCGEMLIIGSETMPSSLSL